MSQKRTHPSADRNSQPIAEALQQCIDVKRNNLKLLEIASGSGQHAGYFAPLFANVSFQPTEYDRDNFESIKAYADDCVSKNILPPVYVDIAQEPSKWQEALFQPASFDYMLNCNMMHISPWNCSEGLFRAAGILLKPQGTMYTYGPYANEGVLTPQSNIDFDASLKSRNAHWGIRDIVELKKLAEQNGLRLQHIKDMPSNNKFLTWIKQ